MENAALKSKIQDDMKSAMRQGEKERLGVIRFLMAAIKQKEIDNRAKFADSGLPDDEIIAVVEKLCKQRRESIEQYQNAGRDDLVASESYELEVLQDYLPPQLSEAELNDIIDAAVKSTGASEMKDMGKVMAEIKPKIQGRADVKAVSAQIKARLNS